jgi:hypothetical protein
MDISIVELVIAVVEQRRLSGKDTGIQFIRMWIAMDGAIRSIWIPASMPERRVQIKSIVRIYTQRLINLIHTSFWSSLLPIESAIEK